MAWSLWFGLLLSTSLVLGDADDERPPARFDHEAHVEALGTASCAACHPRNGHGELLTTLPEQDRDQAHDACADCHLERGQGPHPALCGACHVTRGDQPQSPVTSGLARFDHDQHTTALADACHRCHHVMDATTGRLVPADGDEAACNDCHAGPELRHAAHRQCVACHVGGPDEPATGPVTCGACHGQSEAR